MRVLGFQFAELVEGALEGLGGRVGDAVEGFGGGVEVVEVGVGIGDRAVSVGDEALGVVDLVKLGGGVGGEEVFHEVGGLLVEAPLGEVADEDGRGGCRKGEESEE